MKKLFVVCAVALTLMVSPCFAIEYCKDFLESGNPGGWSESLKTFDDEWTMEVGDEIDLDIWINDISLPLLSGGFWIEYDPSKVSIVSVAAYDGYDIPGPGPWEVAFTSKVSDAGGPGTYMLSVGPPLMPAAPDGDGDIIIGKVRFHCESEGDATITISTIPGLDTFVGDTTVFDPEIIPNTITIHQIILDSDTDGIPDHEDNCPLIPNGPDLGSCAERWCSNIVCVTSACLNDVDCEYNEICQINQEDADSDGMGDVCDPCPNSADQEDNYPPGGNGIGDACECEGDFDYDGNMDGYDAAIFKTDFGRSIYINPCTNEWLCNGDFDCDGDVDGGDAALFKGDYGRSPYHCLNCPCREVEQWCVYDEIPFVGSCSNSGCLGGFMQDGGEYGCGDAEIVAEVTGNVIHLAHFNAFYNCCPDDIAVTMTVEENLLRLRETEINVGCRCMCCYTVESEIGGVEPGEYTIEYCWNYPGTPVCDTLSVTVSQ